MPAGKLVFSGMELVKSSRGGSSVRISVWRGTSTGGSTEDEKRRRSESRQNVICYPNLKFNASLCPWNDIVTRHLCWCPRHRV